MEFLINAVGAVKEVNQRYVIPSHSIACCGAAFSRDRGRSLASGDLAGNVWVTEERDYSPIHTSTVELISCMSDPVLVFLC